MVSNIRAPAGPAGWEGSTGPQSAPREARGGVVGALAETDRVAEGRSLAGGGVNGARRAPERRISEPARRPRVTWNVLAEELVPFPPAVNAGLPVAGIVPLGDPVTAPNERATFVRSPRVAPRSRGLRRLLPGAATLAVLFGVWLGAGALSSLNRPSLTVIPGAVKVPGGYLYPRPAGRHAVVDRLEAPARRGSAAARREAPTAAAWRRTHGGRPAQAALRRT